MNIEKVYDSSGHSLGDEYISLINLQLDTKKAILHLAYLDECSQAYEVFLNKSAKQEIDG